MEQVRFDRVAQRAGPATRAARVFVWEATAAEKPTRGSGARDGGLDASAHVRIERKMARARARGRAYGWPSGYLRRWAGNPL
jgi:hypothetical protein